jgi:hypothetical protein
VVRIVDQSPARYRHPSGVDRRTVAPGDVLPTLRAIVETKSPHVYVFPTFSLGAGKSVRVESGTGANKAGGVTIGGTAASGKYANCP